MAQETFDAISDFGLTHAEARVLASLSPGAGGNVALLRQMGYDGLVGQDNVAAVGQFGGANLSVVIQEGAANTTSSVQAGQGNVVGVRLRGVGNHLGTASQPGVLQIGEGNLYLLDFAGDHQTIAPTTQIGMDNQVVQLGNVTAPLGVQQVGNGMRMIIRHNGAQ
jgi:hypothetical protein